MRRNKGSVSAATIVLLTLVGGVVGTTIGFIHAENALIAESVERANAENARDHAWNALDAMTSTLTGGSLGTQKEVAPEQKLFLRTALDSYRVLAEGSANDEKARARAADAARRVGHIELILGEFQLAAHSSRSAAESFAALAADFPENQDYRRSWSLSLSDTGLALQEMGRLTEAKPLIEQSIAISRRLATEHPEDYRHRSDTAVRLFLLGTYLLQLGHADDANKSLSDAKELLDRLIEEKKEFENHRVFLAGCHSALGNAARGRSDFSEAERHFRRAIELLESTDLNRARPMIALPSLSAYYNNLGRVLCQTGRREEGLKHLRRSIDIQRGQVEKHPSRPEMRQSLATSIMNLSALCDDRQEAITLIHSAIDVMERLVKDHPEAAGYPVELAGLYCNLGLHLRHDSRIPESIMAFDKAAALLDKHRAKRGATPQSTDFLGKSLNGRALSRERAMQWRPAADDHRRVAKLVSPKEVPTIRLDVALCLAKAGDAAAAIAELELVERDRPLGMFETFTRSRIHAMLAGLAPDRRREFSDRAIAGLEKALRGGLSRPMERLGDEDFKPLRDCDDFKNLVREYSEKAKGAKTAKG